MNCPRCGAQLKESSKFCSSCGGRVDDPMFSAARQAPPQQAPAAQGYSGQQQVARPAYPVNRSFDFDKLLVNQKRLSLGNVYYVFNEQGQEMFFVWRKLLALKRHIKIFTDKSMQQLALEVLQDRIFMILYADYTVTDPAAGVVAKLRRRNIISILRRTWDVMTPDGTLVARVAEDSWGMALFRRFGPFGEWFKTDFIFEMAGRVIGKFVRRITLFDKYALDLTGDPQRAFDRRVALAMCVLLDSAEGR